MPVNNFDLENSWYISDLHLNHYWINKSGEERGVILFERTEFKTIEEHDEYIWNSLYSWASNHIGATLFILGDFGDISQLWRLDNLRYDFNIHLVFIYGNHDSKGDLDKFELYFDEVYLRPIYISDRVIVSHHPVWPCPEGCINVHGHLHGSVLDSQQHLCASTHIINYQPFSWKKVCKQFNKVPKASYKFLEEPWADAMVYLQDRSDLVLDKNGKLNVKATKRKWMEEGK